jgi:drug/metabolite transporter (DMT)-like permease
LFVNRKQLKTILPTNKQFILPVIGGFIFFFPVILNLIAYAHIPGTIASSITQLCTLWTLLVSVLVFKEYNVKKS